MLLIDTRTLLRELAWLGRHGRVRKATISAVLGHALIVAGPLEVSIPCRGELPGALTFDAKVLRNVVRTPPPTRDIEVSYADGILQIGSLTVPATN